ncbi:outer membrane protein [Catalinimonas alkaloidigena]|uniref:Outer membrane protein n=1 Tax=Catalinimonas alkaloidigena TaxID=1075417 RepID=A0A1G9BXQ4_9BACT|nr:TolC family protein [Catalinimonas alkaloidigena]SDK44251.1 outer membrane protein [Catalinimonas alkaloidigena]
MKKLFCLLLGTCVAFSAAAQTDTLTFEQAVRIARQQNLDLRLLENQLDLNEAQRAQAYANFLPSASLYSNAFRSKGLYFDQSTGRLFTTTLEQMNAGFTANLNLFQGFGRINQLRASQAQVIAQRKGIEQQRQQLVSLVAQNYLQVLLDRELVAIAQQNLDDQQQLETLLENYAEIGTRPITDYYNQRAQVKKLALQLIQAKNKYRVDQAQFIQLLQLPPTRPFYLSSPQSVENSIQLENNSLDLNEMYDLALQNRPDVQQQEKLIEAWQSNLQVQRASYMPTLSAFYEYATRYSTSVRQQNPAGEESVVPFDEQFWVRNPNTYYGLSLSIPIFSRYQTRTTVIRAKTQLREAQLNEEKLKRTIFTDIQTALLEYQAAVEQLDAAKISVEAAQLAYEAQNERFKLGAGDFVELYTANTNLVQAKSELAQARFANVFRKIMLDYQTGQLREDFIE